MPIHILSSQLAAKIAAGEVVERPASVVKELVENALDAGATNVSVEIVGGGLELIRVVDNGCGIPAREVELAFSRFATSKLSTEGNMDSITTLGFRGEALPSIAAVSTVSLITRPIDQTAGTLVDVAAGEIIRNSPQGSAPGTSITVSNLFQNVPARLKFLKSKSAEISRIHVLLHHFAIAFPTVRFSLHLDGRTSFTSPGSNELLNACSAVYGTMTAKSLLNVAYAGDDAEAVNVQGLISPPDISRANRSYISIIVNRRWIHNRALNYAVEEAYRGFLVERRYPIAVIHLAIPTQDLDVNVHPAKLEVRFHHEREVFSILQRAIRAALVDLSPVPTVRSSFTSIRSTSTPSRSASFGSLQLNQALALYSSVETTDTALIPKAVIPSLRVLGQVQSLYIVTEGPDGLYLIDQHAAHERVLYEKIRANLMNNDPQIQGLLEPVVLELPTFLEEVLESHREEWSIYGFELDNFGPHSYLLRGFPAYINNTKPEESFLAILEEIGNGDNVLDWDERMARSIACHSAVRAGKILIREEMEGLLEQLVVSAQPNTCPHGRPTMIHLSSAYLDREFSRR